MAVEIESLVDLVHELIGHGHLELGQVLGHRSGSGLDPVPIFPGPADSATSS